MTMFQYVALYIILIYILNAQAQVPWAKPWESKVTGKLKLNKYIWMYIRSST